MTTVTYEDFILNVVKGVEALGGAIMVIGGLFALGEFALASVRSTIGPHGYRRLRQRLGQSILLGLEVLIVGDIVRTIIVDATLKSVAVLGIIILIRIVLSFSLEVEIDGIWPWNLWRLRPQQGEKDDIEADPL